STDSGRQVSVPALTCWRLRRASISISASSCTTSKPIFISCPYFLIFLFSDTLLTLQRLLQYSSNMLCVPRRVGMCSISDLVPTAGTIRDQDRVCVRRPHGRK